MCAVSATHDYFRQNVPITQWDNKSWDEYLEIIRRLELLDEKLDQKDCVDPAKEEWMKEVEKRLKKLEKGK